jgi:membrane associated rhomboid family serine protease
MIPLRDNVPPRRTPVVNYAIIGATTFVFLLQLFETEQDRLVERYGMIPARITRPQEPVLVRDVVLVRTPFGLVQEEVARPTEPLPFSPWVTLLTCMFLHGGWLHFLGNVWFLHIFGDNVEDRMGRIGYLAFYLASGIAAGVAHLAFNHTSTIPTIGASGAIAGVMGAYFVLYPHAMVLTLVPILFIIEVVVLPAFVFLGLWFVLQFFQGAFSIVSMDAQGVAWWAHIGGFIAGMLLAQWLRDHGRLRPRVELVVPNTGRIGHYRTYRVRRHW